MNIDVIVGLINKLFGRISAKRRFKVIITSASMDVKLFEDYFREYGLNIRFNTIKVPGRMYPVKIKYFDYQSIKQSIMKISKIIDEEIIPYED